MSVALQAKLVRVVFETGETGRIYATSPDLRGLLVGRRTMPELEEILPQAISDLYAAAGVHVVVSKLSDEGAETPDAAAWVAFPAEVARRALAETCLPG